MHREDLKECEGWHKHLAPSQRREEIWADQWKSQAPSNQSWSLPHFLFLPKEDNPEGFGSVDGLGGRVFRFQMGAGVLWSLVALPHRKKGCSSPKCRVPWTPAHLPTSSLEVGTAMSLKKSCTQYSSCWCSVFCLGRVTHLFLPCVTHSSATRRRSEMLRDRPSPVVPFTVPNKESVSQWAVQCLLFLQTQVWKCGIQIPAREEGTLTNTTARSWEGKMPCVYFLGFFLPSPHQKQWEG
jgi:hypothetical protein